MLGVAMLDVCLRYVLYFGSAIGSTPYKNFIEKFQIGLHQVLMVQKQNWSNY